MNKFKLSVAGITIVISSSLLAHSGATGIVKERMDAMKDMSKKSKRVANMFKGKTEFEHTALVQAADAFVLHGKNMAAQFPDTHDSRMGKKTEALPEIWQQWDEFNDDINEFISLSKSLQQTVATTDDRDALKKAFIETKKSCSSCHKQFRKPKK